MSFLAPRLLALFFGVFFLVSGAVVYAESPGGGGSGCSPSSTASTNAATNVSASGALLNGTVNGACGGSSTGYFRYSTVSASVCASGTRAPTSGTLDPAGDVVTGTHISQSISGLLPSTTYYFCVRNGAVSGTILSFTTLNIAPAVVTGSETNVGPTTATLNGTVDANGDATTYYYRYGLTNTGNCNTLTTPTTVLSAGSGQSPINFPRNISGLTVSKTYYYCIIATNSAGARTGAIGSLFTTSSLPQLVTTGVNTITSNSAFLYGTIDPNGATASGWFRYSPVVTATCDDTFGTKTSVLGGFTGTAATSYNRPTGAALAANTTYYFCALGSNSFGLGKGAIVSFTTLGPPGVVTFGADPVGATTATLNGSIDPNGYSTGGWFRYSTSTDPGACLNNFGTLTPAGTYGPAGGAVPMTQNLVGLQSNTTYYYCNMGYNQGSVYNYGTIESFTTLSVAPTITTDLPAAITYNSTTLKGTVNPNGSQTDTWYRWGSTITGGDCSTLANYTWTNNSGSGRVSTPIPDAPITGLSPNTTYYYCAYGYNGTGGDTSGTFRSFTTSAAPPPQCANGIDDDGDGFIDLADSGCASAADNSESIVTSMSITASPTRVRSGGTTTLTYDTGGRTLCSIAGTNGHSSGTLAAGSGTFTTIAITQITTYTLSCTGDVATTQVIIQRIPTVIEI